MAARGLEVVSDTGALTAAVDEAIAANPDVADKIRDGKVAAAGALVGAVMKTTRGQADAKTVRELILAPAHLDGLGAPTTLVGDAEGDGDGCALPSGGDHVPLHGHLGLAGAADADVVVRLEHVLAVEVEHRHRQRERAVSPSSPRRPAPPVEPSTIAACGRRRRVGRRGVAGRRRRGAGRAA